MQAVPKKPPSSKLIQISVHVLNGYSNNLMYSIFKMQFHMTI